jgi:hypothetical protein
MLTIPTLVILIGLPYLAYALNTGWLLITTMIVVSILIGIAVAWLYWAYVVVKWRTWAFTFVDQEYWLCLVKAAVTNKIIWPIGHEAEATEIRSIKEQQFIDRVYENISYQIQIENIEKDFNTAQEINYKFNKIEVIAELGGKTLLLLSCTTFVSWRGLPIILLALAISIFYGDGYKYIKHLTNRDVYLSVTSTGIEYKLANYGLIFWSTITEVKVIPEDQNLQVKFVRNSTGHTLIIEAKRLKIGSWTDFLSDVHVMIDRYVYSQVGN